MLAPKSHTYLAKMDLRRMKEGAVWSARYVDTVKTPVTHANHEETLTNV